MSNNSNTLLAFVLGAAMGGITALLLAPDKGEVTRRRLRDGSSNVIRRSTEAVEHAASAVGEAARDAGQTVSGAARQQANAVSSALSEAKDAYVREVKRT